MTFHLRPRHLLPVLVLASAVLALPAQALGVMDLRAEQLMLGADSIRQGLELTPNQQTLWQQTASRAQALLRVRKQRRERLQAELKAALAAGTPDLRDLDASVEAEASASAAEERQLRELWLTVNDALTDKQRSQVIGLLLSQLERVEADGLRGPAGAGGREGGREGREGGRGGPAGGRGARPGGAGMGAGMGGIGG